MEGACDGRWSGARQRRRWRWGRRSRQYVESPEACCAIQGGASERQPIERSGAKRVYEVVTPLLYLLLLLLGEFFVVDDDLVTPLDDALLLSVALLHTLYRRVRVWDTH